jgi:hypothetical protein
MKPRDGQKGSIALLDELQKQGGLLNTMELLLLILWLQALNIDCFVVGRCVGMLGLKCTIVTGGEMKLLW